MNIGEKISMLKESLGFKNYSEYGKAVGLPGDWLLQLSKKDSITTVDITRLLKIVEYHNMTLDCLLKDDDKYIVKSEEDLPENDLCKMLEGIQKHLQNKCVMFNGCDVNKNCKNLVFDSIEILKSLVKNNL